MVRPILALLVAVALLVPSGASAASRYVSDAAGGPVTWEAWGTRAIERSKREKRPIFLSIGFASSFDCFLMQRSVFSDAQIAATLNSYYVPVLLDRLEHPEVAETYEAIARSMNGTTGWPIHLILNSSLEPYAVAGFLETNDMRRFLASPEIDARPHVEKARALGDKRAPAPLDPSLAGAIHDSITSNGVQPMAVSYLLRHGDRTLATDVLHKLAMSPLHDHLGGGFHRAMRNDKEPYFEKMLADQALIAIAYLEAWQLTRDPELERMLRSTLDAALRDFHPKNGAFDASQDAHSLVPAKGPEFWNGAFYVWTKDEISHLLGHEGAAKVFRLYGMKDVVRNVPAIEDARQFTDPQLPPLLAKLLDVRQKRPQPFREWNVISGLNGLMISALARGGAVLGEKRYIDAATLAARILTKKKTLVHSEGVDPLAEDYAMLAQGLLDLFEATYDPSWLQLAITLQQKQDELFWDESFGRYRTGVSVPEGLRGILVEEDRETPAVNSVAAMNLLRLSMLTGNETWRARPAMIFQSFGTRLRTDGARLPQLASAYLTSLASAKIAVVVGDARKKPTYDLLHTIHDRWEPLRFVLFVPHKGPARDRIVKALPFTAGLAADPEQAVEYECTNGECRRR